MFHLRKKILVISHMPKDSNYGAATSLRGHLQALGQDVEVVVAYGIDFRSPFEILKGILGVHSDRMFLPHQYNYDAIRLSRARRLLEGIRLSFSKIFFWRLKRLLREVRPDVIHLNSLVLSELVVGLDQECQRLGIVVVSHVREVLSDPCPVKTLRALPFIRHFICIDTTTRGQLIRVSGGRVRDTQTSIVQNPFSPIPDCPRTFIGSEFDRQVVFAIVGKVSEDKGVDLVCRAFLRLDEPDSILLIVGEYRGQYGKMIEAMKAASGGRIRLLGEVIDLQSTDFFGSVDYLVRGDATFRTGRTVYEALYSGADVVIPGDSIDIARDDDLKPFVNRIKLFSPGNVSELSVQLMACLKCGKKRNRQSDLLKDNFIQYRESVKNVYSRVTGGRI